MTKIPTNSRLVRISKPAVIEKIKIDEKLLFFVILKK